MKAVLKINIEGCLVRYNQKLRRYESVYQSWSWDDIHPDHLEESKENWERYQED